MDEGLTWSPVNKGIDQKSPVTNLCSYKGNLYASAGFEYNVGFVGLYKSTNQGRTWSKFALNNKICRFVTPLSNERLFVGTHGDAIYLTRNDDHFIQVGQGIDNWETFRITCSNNDVFASGSGIWRFSQRKQKWEMIRKSISTDVAVTPNGRLLLFEHNRILSSEDRGTKWSVRKNIIGDYGIFKVLNEKLLIANIAGGGSWYSNDKGLNWAKYDLQEAIGLSMRTAGLTQNGTLLLSGSNSSAISYRSTNLGKSFERVHSLDSLEVWDYAVANNVVFAATYASGIFKSIDDGITWSASNKGLRKVNEYLTITSMSIINDNTILCTTLGKGCFISMDQGESWQNFSEGLSDINFWTSCYNNESRTAYIASPSGIYTRRIR